MGLGAAFAPAAEKKIANHNGVVFVLEYHKVAAKETRWDRSIKRFKGDLQRLYDMGFRPVTLRQYVTNDMKLGLGQSPVVITFDDANPTQLQLDSKGRATPDCAVGIWQAFAEKHPDFPVKATFFVLPNVMWGKKKEIPAKIAMLDALQCEIASHTVTHPQLSKLSDEKVKKELGGAIDSLESFGLHQPFALAFPYGLRPKNRSLSKGFTWNGKRYEMYAAVLVGSNPAPSPLKLKDPYAIPRIQGVEGDQGITYWLDRVQRGKVRPYVQ